MEQQRTEGTEKVVFAKAALAGMAHNTVFIKILTVAIWRLIFFKEVLLQCAKFAGLYADTFVFNDFDFCDRLSRH
jgi:hypothetical protein